MRPLIDLESPVICSTASTKRRIGAICLAVGLVSIGVVGCAKEDPATSAAGNRIKIELTDAGCKPNPAKTEAGTIAFDVTNDGANGVSEAELLESDGQGILGERENITPGLSKTFSLKLGEGTYKVYCPGAQQDTWTFTVKGGEKVADWRDNPALVKAVNAYAAYVRSEANELVTRTKAFAAKVKAGDIEGAKTDYATARVPYERIEPVAESFGDLDPKIDGRLGDNGDKPSDFIGFHRIEKALWVDGNLDGMGPIADELVKNVEQLNALIIKKANDYSPNEISSGAVELVNEVLTSKITGEEERYSHTDLVDFQANFDGTMKIIELLRPVLNKSAPELVADIDKAAKTLQDRLDTLKANPGYLNTGFVEWSCAVNDTGHLAQGCTTSDSAKVTVAQRRALADAGKPLADLIGQVPVKVLT